MSEQREKIIAELKGSGAKKVKVAITDIDGILRGKIIHVDKFLSALEGGFGFCDVVFGWDSHDLCYEDAGVELTGWHTGYPDAQAEIDINTYRQVPWEGNIPFFLADFRNKEGADLSVCPRGILKKAREEAKQLGYECIFAQEFEWFNFKEDSAYMHERDFKNLDTMTKGMFGYSVLRASQMGGFFHDLFDLLDAFDVTIEGLHTETGPGVYEAAILYQEVLEAADRAALFKSSVKEIGHQHDIIPTFMAKWNSELPGCSGHIHQSLWKGGKNIFFDEKSKDKMSNAMKSYIAGQLHCLPHILPMFAPTINSYKRLVEGMWAPTTLTWAIDNRTTAIRALPGSSKSTRIETRVVGSDVNPYLAMAGALASGLYGIKNNLKLDIPMSIGNGYLDKKNGVLPSNLWDASIAMEQSKLANELFGEDFVKHFTATRKWEWRQFGQAVTDWELKRYLEII